MRLLTKGEVQRNLTVERKMSIDEGMSLARRVDALRKAADTEQNSFEKWRASTNQILDGQIATKIAEKQKLEREITTLEIKRRELTAPLDKEWARIAEVLEIIADREKELDGRDQANNDHANTLDAWEKSLEKRQREADSRMNVANQKLAQATGIMQQAERLLEVIEERKIEVTNVGIETEQKLYKREVEVGVRERDIELLRVHVEQREEALNDGEKALADKYKTLERAQREIIKSGKT